MAKALKEQGVNEYPIIMAWSQKEGAFPEAWTSMVFGQHEGPNAMFDADLKPVLQQGRQRHVAGDGMAAQSLRRGLARSGQPVHG